MSFPLPPSPQTQTVTMAQMRSKSARVRSARPTYSRTVSNAELHELARSKTSIRDFAETHTLRAKSEVGVEQALREASRRQAWAPPGRQSLSSSSSTFQRKPSEPLPPHPNAPLRSPRDADNAKVLIFTDVYMNV